MNQSVQSYEMAVFVRIAERGSFAAAASDFELSPSAVSKIVTRTERRLGVSLLTRTTRRLSLTQEGEVYLERARTILDAITDAEAEVSQGRESPSGRLRISCGTAFGMHFLVPALSDFQNQFPLIDVELNITDRQVDLVAEQIDIGVRMGSLGDSSLIAKRIGQSRRVICASPAYLENHGTPQTPADLANHNCMTISHVSNLTKWPFSTPEGINRLSVHGNFSTDSAEVLRHMALAGQGIVRLARFLLIQDIRAGRLVPILTDHHNDETFPMSLVMPVGPHRAPRVRAFVNFITEKLRSVEF